MPSWIFSIGDVQVKRFVLNDKERALKEQFLKRYNFDTTVALRIVILLINHLLIIFTVSKFAISG